MGKREGERLNESMQRDGGESEVTGHSTHRRRVRYIHTRY